MRNLTTSTTQGVPYWGEGQIHLEGLKRMIDAQKAVGAITGRLLPFGWAKFLYWRRRIDRVRVFALGVKAEHQHTGVAARFYDMHYDAAQRTPQKAGETGWILESNTAMNRAMEGMGGTVSARYRIYERELAATN